MGWVGALCSVLLVSAAQLLMKWAMIQLPTLERPLDFAAAILTFSPPALAGGEEPLGAQ